jgi:outer membrane cobalamin receptor
MKYSLLVFSLVCASTLRAQDTTRTQDSTRVRRDSVAKLGAVKVTAERVDRVTGKPLQLLTLPVTASVTARKVEQTVNIIDAEDAVKYLPSVTLRKRNNGDTQAVMGTRVWGYNSSARSLIFADGVPLSALIANNNTIGGPRWGLVSPGEISRIDMMYGPFSAAYAGNSMGAVMEITTRMPDSLGGSIGQTQALQRFDLYGTQNTYGTSQTTGDIGNRFGKFSFLASGNYQNSNSQPLQYVTSATFPTGTTGGFADRTSSAQRRTCSARRVCCTPDGERKAQGCLRLHARPFAGRTRSASGRTRPTRRWIRTSRRRIHRRTPARLASRAGSMI